MRQRTFGGGTLRRASGRPELPGREGAGQVATRRAEFRRPACGGSPGRRRVERAGIPGLVSLRFAGAGSPQEPAGYDAGRGPAGKGLPAQPPGLRRATAVEGSARGLGPGDRQGDRAWVGMGEGARTGVLEGFAAEWVKSRDRGSGAGSGARAGGELVTWAGVAGELRTSPLPYRGGSSGLLCWR